ncbi:MAG: hypothetical protein RR500_05260 [Bacilli bacterium]
MELVQMLAGVCQGVLGAEIPAKLAYIVALAIRFFQVIIPILLIIWGMLDLGRAVMEQKEDDIKKRQGTFIKRLTAAAIVFFVITIVKLLVNLVAGGDGQADAASITSCINSVINCKSSTNCG